MAEGVTQRRTMMTPLGPWGVEYTFALVSWKANLQTRKESACVTTHEVGQLKFRQHHQENFKQLNRSMKVCPETGNDTTMHGEMTSAGLLRYTAMVRGTVRLRFSLFLHSTLFLLSSFFLWAPSLNLPPPNSSQPHCSYETRHSKKVSDHAKHQPNL